jgi:hypothetical protein
MVAKSETFRVSIKGPVELKHLIGAVDAAAELRSVTNVMKKM